MLGRNPAIVILGLYWGVFTSFFFLSNSVLVKARIVRQGQVMDIMIRDGYVYKSCVYWQKKQRKLSVFNEINNTHIQKQGNFRDT